MSIVAIFSAVATCVTGVISLLGGMLAFHGPGETGSTAWILYAVLIGMPLFALATTVVATVATVTGQRKWIWTAIAMFVPVAIGLGLFSTWFGLFDWP